MFTGLIKGVGTIHLHGEGVLVEPPTSFFPSGGGPLGGPLLLGLCLGSAGRPFDPAINSF